MDMKRHIRYLVVAILVLVGVLINNTFVKANEVNLSDDKYMVILEENKSYDTLAASVYYIDKDDIITLVTLHLSGNEIDAEVFFLKLIQAGKVISIPHALYLVEFVEMGEGYTIYKVLN